MKISQTLARLALATALLGTSAAAFAHDVANAGYLIDSRGNIVKNNFKECWRTGYWTPALAVEECDPSLVKKVEPKKAEPAPAPAPKVVEAPAPAPVPMAVVGPEKPAFEKITLQAETLFDFDKAVVRADGKAILDKDVVAKMKQYPQVEVVLVTGHADRIGTDAYNMALSQRRADAVKEYLVAQGVDKSRVETAAKGEAEPVVSCTEVKGKQLGTNLKLVTCLQPNRRVVVEVKVQKSMQK